ncbi:hypothetical protein HN011_007314 [Eciton burchellii]|nr:hypothetical protein HN011_007314 [Eciton burchellii]
MMRQWRDDETVRHARSSRLIASAASGSDSDGPGVRRSRFEKIQLIEERRSINHGSNSSLIACVEHAQATSLRYNGKLHITLTCCYDCAHFSAAELDLDYLERRGGNTIIYEGAEGGSKEEDSPVDTLDRVKVVFLGAPGVGKTSIIRQFVWSEFSEEYRPTERRETFYPSVVLADRLYELKITDLPTIPYFPVSSHLEWTDFRYCGLRSATAYVLVFDLSNQDTFQYIRTLREQIYEARDMRGVPLLVVGNKQDELSQAVALGTRYRDIVNLVRKHWRCGYVECSARFNCRVVQVFRELMKSIQAIEGRPTSPSPAASQPMRSLPHDASEKCILL